MRREKKIYHRRLHKQDAVIRNLDINIYQAHRRVEIQFNVCVRVNTNKTSTRLQLVIPTSAQVHSDFMTFMKLFIKF